MIGDGEIEGEDFRCGKDDADRLQPGPLDLHDLASARLNQMNGESTISAATLRMNINWPTE